MKLFVRTLLLGSLGLSAAIAGRPAAAADPAGSPDSAAKPAAEPKKEHHHGGMIGDALRQLDLTPQQMIQAGALRQMLMPSRAESRQAKHALLLGLADQLESGTVDEKALAPQIAAYVRAELMKTPVEHAVFEALHNILTPEQRTKFAQIIEDKVEKKSQKMESGAWLDKLGETLSLTDAQKDQIKADLESIKPGVEAHRALFGKVLEAFKGDQFSMEQVVPNYNPGKHAVEVAGMMVKATQEAAKILTPEQRKIAAEKIRERVGGGERPAAPTGVTAPTSAPAAPAPTGRAASPVEEETGSSEDAQLVAPYGVGTAFGGYPTGYVAPIPGGYAYGYNNPGIGYSYAVPGASGYSYSSGYSTGYVSGFPSFGLTPFAW